MPEDFEVEDILANLHKKEKKRKNSKEAGTRGENQVCDVFKKRFPGRSFFRVTGSGNRWSQVELTQENRGVFTSDVVCPSDFRFCLECKYGYEDIDFFTLFRGAQAVVDGWMVKVQRDADSVAKQPMVIWRKPHHKWLAFLKIEVTAQVVMTYREWTLVALDELLAMDDAFWFRPPDGGGSPAPV